tara:strand:- start:423 stop:965 length:543 start_codon:yes stop_codon:yes gene_type:complete
MYVGSGFEEEIPVTESPRDNTGMNIRPAVPQDMAAVSAIDAKITGAEKPEYWSEMFERFGRHDGRYFLMAETAMGSVSGYIVGEVRAWEFGSPPCGWIFAIGVDPDERMRGIGTGLFDSICTELEARSIDTVRTMTARDDELIISFFRSQGMMGGPFIELEMPLGGRDRWHDGAKAEGKG